MSGYTDSSIAQQGVLEAGISLLHKPFTEKNWSQDPVSCWMRVSEVRPDGGPALQKKSGGPAIGPGMGLRRLLIVDDDDAMRRLLRLNLSTATRSLTRASRKKRWR